MSSEPKETVEANAQGAVDECNCGHDHEHPDEHDHGDGDDDPLVPMFMPPLLTLCLMEERKKGSPLTQEDVERVRDTGICMMVPLSHYRFKAEMSGRDLDPENAWEDWQDYKAWAASQPADAPPE
jgi:hypothetical protein